MDEATRARADARYAEALARSSLRDPREQFRDWLRQLRERDAAAFEEALRYFEHTLVPRVADPASDPVTEWIEYGRLLAGRLEPGRVVAIDATGRSHAYQPPPPPGALLLHLPDDARARAAILSLPQEPSAAQRAACDLLVLGKVEPGRG